MKDSDGEVVLFVGYPGAGKSTLSEEWVARGYERLNRDETGGALATLLPRLEASLASGQRRVVLDNTYPKRESRFDVIDAAHRGGVPVRCVWLQTTLERAQVNAVRRMLSRYGRLLGPEEMRVSQDPNAFGPGAQFAYRRELEAPRLDEGFLAIDETAFEPRRNVGSGKAIVLDAFERSPRCLDVLGRFADDGYRLIVITFLPGASEERALSMYEGLGVDVFFCPHEPPAMCWCRKPMPGLGVVVIEAFGLDPAKCVMVGDSAADRGFAARLGFRLVSVDQFFGDQFLGES